MISEPERYHGIALARLIRNCPKPCCIARYAEAGNAAYSIDQCLGLYMKYSSKRLSPWRFTFNRAHWEEFDVLRAGLGVAYLLLVCGGDGIALLSIDNLSRGRSVTLSRIQWISVSRRPREKFTITTSEHNRRFKVGDNDYPRIILQELERL